MQLFHNCCIQVLKKKCFMTVAHTTASCNCSIKVILTITHVIFFLRDCFCPVRQQFPLSVLFYAFSELISQFTIPLIGLTLSALSLNGLKNIHEANTEMCLCIDQKLLLKTLVYSLILE